MIIWVRMILVAEMRVDRPDGVGIADIDAVEHIRKILEPGLQRALELRLRMPLKLGCVRFKIVDERGDLEAVHCATTSEIPVTDRAQTVVNNAASRIIRTFALHVWPLGCKSLMGRNSSCRNPLNRSHCRDTPVRTQQN